MDPNVVENLRALAQNVAAEHTQSVEATRAEENAAARLVETVVAAVLPSLPAICSRIETSYRLEWVDSAITDDRSTYFALRGLYLATEGDATGPVVEHSGASRSRYVGTNYFLLTDGSFLELDYSGRRSQWQGEGSSWDSTPRIVDAETLFRECRDTDFAETIVGAISRALAKAEGSRAKVIKASRERAERLASLATLMRK